MIKQTSFNDFYPAIVNESDNYAKVAQKKYMILIFTDIIFMVISVLISLFYELNYQNISFIVLLLFFTSLIISIILLRQSYDKLWFECRAISESVKSLSWLYAMGSSPYDTEKDSKAVIKLFITRIKELLNQYSKLASYLGIEGTDEEFISLLMNKLRSQNPESRKTYYIENRIKDQQQWYHNKCIFNRKRATFYNITIIVIQFIALVLAANAMVNPKITIHIVGLLATTITGILSWLQIKQHQQLAYSYGLAAQELSMIALASADICNEIDLGNFVDDSENAISREHVMWLARRDMA